jgi:hypothetical protein
MTVIIGRDRELAEIHSPLDEAVARRGGVLFVCAGAGSLCQGPRPDRLVGLAPILSRSVELCTVTESAPTYATKSPPRPALVEGVSATRKRRQHEVNRAKRSGATLENGRVRPLSSSSGHIEIAAAPGSRSPVLLNSVER